MVLCLVVKSSKYLFPTSLLTALLVSRPSNFYYTVYCTYYCKDEHGSKPRHGKKSLVSDAIQTFKYYKYDTNTKIYKNPAGRQFKMTPRSSDNDSTDLSMRSSIQLIKTSSSMSISSSNCIVVRADFGIADLMLE